MSPSWPNVSWVGVVHYALQVRDNILVDSVRPLTYSQPAATNRQTGPAEQQTPLPGEILKYKYLLLLKW